MLTSEQYWVIGVAFLVVTGGLVIFLMFSLLENYAFASNRFIGTSFAVAFILMIMGQAFLVRSGRWPRARKTKN